MQREQWARRDLVRGLLERWQQTRSCTFTINANATVTANVQ